MVVTMTMNTQLEIFYEIVIIVFGIFIGSFLNVCIFRIPRKESVVVTRSHCMSCGEQIKWYDLIPVLSFIILRGKCRHCKTKLSLQYPLVEFTNGVGYAIIVIINGVSVETILYCLCTSALLTLSVIDWKTYEIPIVFNAFIGVLGIIRLLTDYKNWYVYVIGFVAVSSFLYILVCATKGRAMGGGDVKLMAVAGLLVGWQNIILALVLGCIFGSIIHSVLMRIKGKDHMLAFGPYLSLGIYISMVCGNEIIQWYLNTFVKR